MSQDHSLKLRQMISSYWVTQLIYAAAKLNIADLLEKGPKHYLELAEKTGTKPKLLYRLLRGLASLGIFAEGPDETFQLTPLASLLQTDHDGSLKDVAIFYGEEPYSMFSHLLHTLKTGEVAFEHVYGTPFFNYLSEYPEKSETFNRAMTNISTEQAKAILSSYDFSNIQTLVDVGGGKGHLLAAILKQYPKMKGILFDQAHVMEEAKQYLDEAKVLDRCQLISGDFFDKIPSDGDAYLLKYIIHDWDDAQSLALLKNLNRAMTKNAKLLIVEQVILPGNEPFYAKVSDLYMLALHGGAERSEQEFKNLLEQAGFQLNRIILTPYLLSVIESSK